MMDGLKQHAGPVYISGQGRAGPIAEQLGRAHYSYQFAESGYRKALTAYGIQSIGLVHPEAFVRAADLPGRSPSSAAPAIHLSVTPPENIRLCRPAYNIVAFAWEFDVLRDESLPGDNPFFDQKTMLGLVDEVWTPSSFSKGVLERYGLSNVHLVPSPVDFDDAQTRIDPRGRKWHLDQISLHAAFRIDINTCGDPEHWSNVPRPMALGQLPAISRAAAANALFVSVVNPYDLRKNLHALILGFHAAASRHPDAALLIKLSLPRGTSAAEAMRIVGSRLASHMSMHSDRIVFLNGYLDEDELSHFYRTGSFFLSAALAEGQHLPLQESMLHHGLAVSPRHTAMSDYLDEQNSIEVASVRSEDFTGLLGGDVARRRFSLDRPRAIDVARSVSLALSLPEADRVRLVQHGRERIKASYSARAVGQVMIERFARASQAMPSHLSSGG